MTKRFATMAVGLTLATFTSLMGADEGCGGPPILENNGFDLWCGAELCSWEVEAGEVVRAPTWHESDVGAQFVGDLVAISQVSYISSSIACLHFRAVANIELSVVMTIEVDYDDDGTYEVDIRIPTSDWARLEFELPTPRRGNDARFRVRKEGIGQAILAEVQVVDGGKCTLPPVPSLVSACSDGQADCPEVEARAMFGVADGIGQ